MKKILFVVDDQKIGGVSIVLREILIKLNKKNQIDLLILNNEGDCLKNIKGVNYLTGSSFFSVVNKTIVEVIKEKNIIQIIKKLNLIFLLKTGLIKSKIKKERKKMFLEKYDTEIAYKDGFCTIFTANGNSNKKITFLHTDYSNNDPSSKYQSVFQDSINKLDMVVSISKDIKRKFNKVYGNKEKTDVIYNYLDKDKIIKNSLKTVIKYNSKLEFITVGRFHPVKGYDRLIEVFNKLNKENLLNGIHLTMIGDGETKKDIEKKIAEYNLEEYITLEGLKNNPYPYIKAADCMLITSISEGYPLTVMESYMLEVPVIALNYSSAKEMINNHINGIILKNDEESLYKGLNEVVDNPNIIHEFKKVIKNEQKKESNIIEKIEEIF